MDGNLDKRRGDVTGKLKAGFAHVPASRVLLEELIRERREEAAREEREFAAPGPIDPEAVRRRVAELKRELRGER